jgi:hypothetical protein
LQLAPDPWGELQRRGHKNAQVLPSLLRLRKLFYQRNLHDEFLRERSNSRARDLWDRREEWIGQKGSGLSTTVEYDAEITVERHEYSDLGWSTIRSKQQGKVRITTEDRGSELLPGVEWHHRDVDFKYVVTLETVGQWLNPYLLEREQGGDGAALLEEVVSRCAALRDFRDQGKSPEPSASDQITRFQAAVNELFEKIQQTVADAFRVEFQRLGDILAQEPIMSETGQYMEEPLIERPIKNSAEVAAEIASQLVTLPNYQARCKLSQKDGPPLECTFFALPFQGENNPAQAEDIVRRSCERIGNNFDEVERGIASRLVVKRDWPEAESRRSRPGDEYEIEFGERKTQSPDESGPS